MEKNYFLEYVKDGDNGKKAREFYKMYFPCFDEKWNGDTWFTPIALLEGLQDKNGYINCIYNSDWKWSSPKDAKLELISKVSALLCSGKNIGKNHSCLANFGFLPLGLNPWRGGFDCEGHVNNRLRLGDFPDLFFECVKCFLENTVPSGNGHGYSIIEKTKLNEYKWWFLKIGCEEVDMGKWADSAWRNFVNQMLLKGSFIDDNYRVVKLFDQDIGNPFPILHNIDVKQKYSTETLVKRLAADPAVSACIKKIYSVFNNRAESLAKIKLLSPSRL